MAIIAGVRAVDCPAPSIDPFQRAQKVRGAPESEAEASRAHSSDKSQKTDGACCLQ